jgi:hypothetical protein
MSQDFRDGDFLIFQLESGYGLLRILRIDGEEDDRVWHVRAYEDLFLDIETADNRLASSSSLTVKVSHAALTTRAFEATQVARMKNAPLDESEIRELETAIASGPDEPSDVSIRLLLGLR